ncbi:hypothetical protein ABZ307_16650 [Streptomyces griseorubiginosus]|uniref:hypothetical protein n=1 Tax=Streptomyces griseorubiginosus TaxID=67304 RepID=UPI0033A12A55
MIDYDADIERILGGPPSKLAFRALCAALVRAGSPAALVSRCDERLASWPDRLREAPWSWLAALAAGHTKPTWQLVRSLRFPSARDGLLDPALPDPRSRPEVRGVTHLDLGWYAHDHLAALADNLQHWEGLRSIRTAGVTGTDADLLTRLADDPALAGLESLDLVSVREDMWHFKKPPFRPRGERPWRLRHAGLRAPDLVHLIRSGLVPELRSADVLVCDLDEARELADCAELARLERLAIGFRCGKNGSQPLGKPYFGNVIEEDDDACETFFARADLAGLRGLTVRGTAMGLGREGLGARGTDALIGSGVLRRLTELSLELLPVGDAAVAGVLRGLDPQRIKRLKLADLVATDLTATAFAAVGDFPRLRHLDLSRNRLGTQGARQLAVDVRMPALEHLDLSGRESGSPYYGRPCVQPVGDAGAVAWAASPNAAALKHLNLAATGLTVNGLTALMTSEGLHRLGTLGVSCNPIGAWPGHLRDAPVWRTLHTFTADDCALGDDAVEALASTVSAPCLHNLSLAYNTIGARGARAFTTWDVLPRLWQLNLHDNVLTEEGLTALASSRAALRVLELDLEQDCWNAHARRHPQRLPRELFDEEAFPSLDAIFLGMVDEYHGARYSSGFSSGTRQELLSADGTRPELRAFLTHLDMELLDDAEEHSDTESDAERAEYDFRTGRAARQAEYISEAQDFARRMIEGDIGRPPPSASETS